MKRIAGLLLATQLAACSGGSGQEGQPPTQQLQTTSVEQSVDGADKQTMLGLGVTGSNPEQKQSYALFGFVMSPSHQPPATQVQEWTNLEPAHELNGFDKVEQALQAEDYSLTNEDDLIEYSLKKIALAKAQREALLHRFLDGVKGPISWDPSHDSSVLVNTMPGRNSTVLFANQNKNGALSSFAGLLVAGERGQQRYAVMSAPLYSTSHTEQTDKITDNVVKWLTRKDRQTKPLSIVAAHIREDGWHPNYGGLKRWLDKTYPDHYALNDKDSCDGDLQACIDTRHPDLIVIGQANYSADTMDAFKAAMDTAKAQGIPLLVAPNLRGMGGSLLEPLTKELGVDSWNNYWDSHQLVDQTIKSQSQMPSKMDAAVDLLNHLKAHDFQLSAFGSCIEGGGKLPLWCDNQEFKQVFKDGADWYRQQTEMVDKAGVDIFKTDGYKLLKAGLLLADTYRQQIDYPIEQTEPTQWQHAMFADWVVSYTRTKNLAQPDLGQYIKSARELKKGVNATYAFPPTVTETRTFAIPYKNQWTTTGWYMLPGQAVTFTRTDENPVKAVIRLNYHRLGTNKATRDKVLRAPIEIATQRVPLAAGKSVTISSPYGGPIYMYMEGDSQPLQITVKAQGIAKHPSILAPTDAEFDRLKEALANTELPHVDLRLDGAEFHMRRDKFEQAIGNKYPDVETLLSSIVNDHVNDVYTLAGLKIQGKNLDQSLPLDVQLVCLSLFGEDDCTDPQLHTRTVIQHANFDESALCGSGCSGNPRDASWAPDPQGWGDNHELGHNLQTHYLDVSYVDPGHEQEWTHYSSRAGENSNNIFPWYVRWKSHYAYRPDEHINQNQDHKDAFFVYMSDALGLKDANGDRVVYDAHCGAMGDSRGLDRYDAPWANNGYAYYNGFRQSFYMQLVLRNQNREMAHKIILTNGFNIITLLYQHSRIFNKYAQSEELWNAHKSKLGFAKFPYSGGEPYGDRTIRGIPGNDFLLVSLSKLTKKDWRPFFDMYGLHYTNLAAEQVAATARWGAVEKGLFALDNDTPPQDLATGLQFLSLEAPTANTVWPTTANRSPNSPVQCGASN